MYFRIKNNDVKFNYPLLEEVFNIVEFSEKRTGKVYNAIDIPSLEKLLELDALCKTTCPQHMGIKVDGNEISLLQQKFEFEDEL